MTVQWQEYDHPEPKETTSGYEPTLTGGKNRGPPFYFVCERGVYVLKLKDKNYYVGCSSQLTERMEQHFTGNGSIWTEEHTPVEVIEVTPMPDATVREMEQKEEQRTGELMERHGVENVRGSFWCRLDLDECPPLPRNTREHDTSSLDKIANEFL